MGLFGRLRCIGIAPVLLTIATFGWGTNAVASRLAVGEVSPMMLICLRWGFLVILILLIRWKEMLNAWPLIRPKLLWVFLMGGGWAEFFQCALLSCGPHDNCTQYRLDARHHAGIYCDWLSCLFWGGH